MARKFILTVDMGNAAFADDNDFAGHELARILRTIAAKLEANGPPQVGGPRSGRWWPLRDLNGNTVGYASTQNRRTR